MSERGLLSPTATWVELRTTDDDWERVDPALSGARA